MLSYGKNIVAIPNYFSLRGIKNVINRVCKIAMRLIGQQTKCMSLFVKRIEYALDKINLRKRNNCSLSFQVNIPALHAKTAVGMNHPRIIFPKTKLTFIIVKEIHKLNSKLPKLIVRALGILGRPVVNRNVHKTRYKRIS